ncbi:MAG: PilZ domain-containing protein [Methylovulum sp.]|nr:PilZ domain-containing protein [Methylovulum sp.]
MKLKENTDNRHFHRIFYKADALLSHQDKTWPCEIVDVSLKGCLLRFEQPWQEDAEQLYTLVLTLSEDTRITMELSVAHVVDNTVGFKCEHIELESASNLRRLVELNLGDSALLERDLLALCGL